MSLSVFEEFDKMISNVLEPREPTHLIPVDLIEEADQYIILADLPGFEVEQVNIEATHDKIKISATIDSEGEVEMKFLRKERLVKNLTRSIQFHKPIDASAAKTTLTNGVLTIQVPLAEQAKTVTLQIGN